MEDRRSAFPGKDYEPDCEPQHNILDGPYMRTENESIDVVHKRYWALLVVAVICIGLFSFYAPTSMMQALHCDKDETSFVYTLVEDSAAFSRDQSKPLNAAAVDVLKARSASHMMQQDAVFDSDHAIVVYPAEDTDYALYATEEAAYVFAIGQEKFRYQIKGDDGALYQALLETIPS